MIIQRFLLAAKKIHGFSLVEVLVGLGIVALLALFAVLSLRGLQRGTVLEGAAQEIISILQKARQQALASEQLSSYGVFFDASSDPHQYILFKGSSFATRDPAFDEIRSLPSSVEFVSGSQTVFRRLTGEVAEPGDVSLRSKQDPSQTKTVYIAAPSHIALAQPPSPSDASRIKDSRHVHFDYTRTIDTAKESITLKFTPPSPESEVTKTIAISSFLKDGQIFWEGEVVVGGSAQKITLRTHRLNEGGSNTQFSVHRDRRKNTVALTLNISGDVSGSLIQYAADGQTTKGTSLYVSEPAWQ